MAAPWIGIGTSFARGSQRLSREYVAAVERAGGVPVLLPLASEKRSVEALVGRLDALVVPGGPGITLGLEGSLPDDLEPTPEERARFDAAITGAFVESGKPVLGICYGMQLLNVLGGGTLHADVERTHPGSLVHSRARGGADHPIRVARGSRLLEILEAEELTVNSRHIQAVSRVAARYHVVARAPDGVVEAIESEDGRRLGVQFHPELMGGRMDRLFRHLVDLARG